MKRILFLTLVLASILSLACSRDAAAASYTWTGNSSNSLGTAGNWNPSTAVPSGSDTATINASTWIQSPNGGTLACASLAFTGSGTLTGGVFNISGSVTITYISGGPVVSGGTWTAAGVTVTKGQISGGTWNAPILLSVAGASITGGAVPMSWVKVGSSGPVLYNTSALAVSNSDVWTGVTYAGSNGLSTGNLSLASSLVLTSGTLHGVQGTALSGAPITVGGVSISPTAMYLTGSTAQMAGSLTGSCSGTLFSGTAPSGSDVWSGLGTFTVGNNGLQTPSLSIAGSIAYGYGYTGANLLLTGGSIHGLAGTFVPVMQSQAVQHGLGYFGSGGTLDGTVIFPPVSAYVGSYGPSGGSAGTLTGSYSGGNAFTLSSSSVINGLIVPSGTGTVTGILTSGGTLDIGYILAPHVLAGSGTGTLTLPAVGAVLAPAYGGPSTFGYSGTGSIGSATLPPPTNVLSGQVFGLSGSGSTGTYLSRRRP
jgi:hypothetical protein